MLSPAQLVMAYLVAEDLLVVPADSIPANSWPCFISSMPAEPDQCAVIYDTTPKQDGRLMRTGESIRHPALQIKLRSLDYPTGWKQALAILASLDTLYRFAVTTDLDINYIVQGVSSAGPLSMGVEAGSHKYEQTKRREAFSINCVTTIVEAPKP